VKDSKKKPNEPNEFLRSERKLRNWTQEDLAYELSNICDEDEVSERGEINFKMVGSWERGEHTPSNFWQKKMCKLFGKNVLELGFVVSPMVNTQEYSQKNTFQSISPSSTGTQAQYMLDFSREQFLYGQVNTSNQSFVQTQQKLQDLGIDMDELRRILVVGIASIAFSPYPNELLNPEPWERLRRALKKPSTVDEQTVDHLETLANDCWRMIPVVAGVVSHFSRGYVLEHLGTVTELLEGSQSAAIHKRLCSIAGGLSLIAANISSNMRDYHTAKTYYELSIEAAQEANNTSLQAVGLVRLSFNSTRNDQPDLALPLVQEANRLVVQGGHSITATTRSWIAAALAEVYANLGSSQACFRALEQAELRTNPEALGEDPYRTTFTSSLLSGYKGVCYMLLHLPDDAEKVLDEALRQLGSTLTYQKGYILSDLAGACMQQGKVEEMYTHASSALTVASQTKSPEVLQRIHKLRATLEPWADTSYVKALNKQIRPVELQFRGKKRL